MTELSACTRAMESAAPRTGRGILCAELEDSVHIGAHGTQLRQVELQGVVPAGLQGLGRLCQNRGLASGQVQQSQLRPVGFASVPAEEETVL